MATDASATAAAAPVASTSQLSVVSVPCLLPSPTSPPSRRTDLVSLKLRLAELLTPEQGTLYWSGLADFFTGRINRNEWDDIMKRAFGRDRTKRQQALKLHNALVLSIVYNTTRPYLPPTSIRHSGFHPRGSKKRARDPPPTELEEKRKRLLKDAVMALGRRERGEVKLLGATGGGAVSLAAGTTGAGSGQVKTKGQMVAAAADEERKRKRRAAEALSEAVGGTSRGGGGSVTADGVPTSLLASGKNAASLSAIAAEFHRIQQAPLCCEARLLPDGDTLHDRMLAVAYEEGLASGVEGRAAVLLSDAMEHHLQDMIASVISLVRGTRRAVPQPLRTAASSLAATPLPSTFAPAGAAPAAPSPAAAGSSLDEPAAPPHGDTDKAVDEVGGKDHDDDVGQRLPLTIADFHALFAISPALLGQYPNIAAVERMYAIAPPDSDSDSDDYDSDDARETSSGAQQQRVTAAGGQRRVTIDASAKTDAATSGAVSASSSATANTGVGAGKHPRLSRSRASSFYGISRPVPVSSPATTIAATAAAGHPPGGAGPVGKGRFVIDPSSTHGVPEGHPSVPPLPSTPQALLLPSWLGGGGSGAHGPGGVGANASSASNASSTLAPPGGPELSPKSIALRNSLFPELAQAHAGATAASNAPAAADAAGPDGNWTSTDAGDSDSDDEGKKAAAAAAATGGAANSARSRNPQAPPTTTSSSSSAGATGTGLKIKFGGGTVQGGQQQQQQTGPSGQRLSASAQGAGSAATDRETGRKLWEVVDSVGLLDGVLPP